MDNIPTVLGWLEKGGKGLNGDQVTLFKFICHGCGKTHTHGWADGGHRGAHCSSDSKSEYLSTGYYLKLDNL